MAGNTVYYPLTNPQMGIYYTEKLYPGTSIGNVAATLKIKENLDFDILEQAINELIKNNDALRIKIREIDNEVFQYISQYEYKKIDLFDFSDCDLDKMYKWDTEQTRTPFNIYDSELFYFALLKISESEVGIYSRMHHLISDGWSVVNDGNKILEYYTSISNSQKTVHMEPSYLEFIKREQEYLNSEKFIKDRMFWDNKFDTLSGITTLKPPKTSINDIEAKRKTFVISNKLSNHIRVYCKNNKSSIFSLFISALLIYINRITSKEEIVIGVPVLNRTDAREKQTTGMYVSTIPLMININNEMNFEDFLKVITEEWLSVLRHQKYPYDLILQNVRKKNKSIEKLFDITLSYQNAKFAKKDNPEKQEGRWHFCGYQTESLYIHINDREDDGNIILDFDYHCNLYYLKEIEYIYDHIVRILWHALDNPFKKLYNIDMLSEKEKYKVLYEFNDTKNNYPYNTPVYRLFENQVFMDPKRIAVEQDNKQYTYYELNLMANRLACFLIRNKIKVGDCITIFMERSVETVAAILGVMKAGAAYIPVDPEYPDDRIKYLLSDSDSKFILTHTRLKNRLTHGYNANIINVEKIFFDNCYSGTNPDICNAPEDLAYIIYTSGSTGNPKGSMITHKGLTNYITWANKVYVKNETCNFPLFSSLSFDLTVTSVFTPLISGNKIVIFSGNNITLNLNNIFSDKSIQIVKLTPSHLNIMKGQIKNSSSIKRLIVGGEDFKTELAKSIYMSFDGNIEIYNEYGPTETTVGCMIYKYNYNSDKNTSVPIGMPADNMRIYILDRHLNPVPIGIPGEIYIGGDGVAKGYLNKPDITSKVFLDDPFMKGERIYKTGDLARWFPKGDIEYLGRIDHQVKIRGYRIELGEIENCLLQHQSIKEATVIAREDKNHKAFLCAYIVVKEEVTVADLRRRLLKVLPHFMVPTNYVILKELPLTSNGKINKNELPYPVISDSYEYAAPRNEIEALLVDIWTEILKIDRIGIDDDFFDIGGDSLTIIQTLSYLYKYKLEVKTHDFYECPTIRELSKMVVDIEDDINTEKDDFICNQLKNRPAQNVHIKGQPLTELILSGRLPKLDAAALSYIPGELIYNESQLKYFKDIKSPVLYNYIDTGFGNIGVYALPTFSHSIYSEKNRLIELCNEAIGMAGKMGAKVVSLTGLIPSATNYGYDIMKDFKNNNVKITTGHNTTASAVILSLERLLTESGRIIEDENICFLGLGSVGTTTIKLLLSLMPFPACITLCDIRQKSDHLTNLAKSLTKDYGFEGKIQIVYPDGRKLPEEVYKASLIIGATNIPDLLDINKLRPGSLIVDDSGPHCFSKKDAVLRLRKDGDILFTEGGVLEAEEPMHKMIYLPDSIIGEILERYNHYFLNDNEITGCILSSLLSANNTQLLPVLGSVDVRECCKNYEVLSDLHFKGAKLHCDDYIIPDNCINRFRNKFGCLPEMKGKMFSEKY